MPKNRMTHLPLFMGLLLFLVCLVSVTLGDASISLAETVSILRGRVLHFFGGPAPTGSAQSTILFSIRIPRILTAVFAGAGLAGVGCVYQGVFRNSMADPYILGISSRATLGAAIAISFRAVQTVWGFGMVTLSAFAGALLATVLVYRLAMRRSRSSVTSLLLSGIAVSFLLSSIVSIILVFDERNASRIIYWTMGSLAGVGYAQIAILAPVVILGGAFLLTSARELDMMSSGEDVARSMGVATDKIRVRLLIGSSLIVAVCVAFTGVIGFVGLMMPHIMRLIVGPSHRRLIPFAMTAGALFLVFSDTIARSLVDSAELPVGAVTALFGAPYFIWLLGRRNGGE